MHPMTSYLRLTKFFWWRAARASAPLVELSAAATCPPQINYVASVISERVDDQTTRTTEQPQQIGVARPDKRVVGAEVNELE
jgi:hypothetical protein